MSFLARILSQFHAVCAYVAARRHDEETSEHQERLSDLVRKVYDHGQP